MTLAELAPELIVLAATLEDRAARVESVADLLVARASTAVWQGPAAERFRISAADQRVQLRAAAAELRQAAADVRMLGGAR